MYRIFVQCVVLAVASATWFNHPHHERIRAMASRVAKHGGQTATSRPPILRDEDDDDDIPFVSWQRDTNHRLVRISHPNPFITCDKCAPGYGVRQNCTNTRNTVCEKCSAQQTTPDEYHFEKCR